MYKITNITLTDLQTGDEVVLQQVYEQNRNKFINFARRFNVTEDDIIDAYQDAYIVFYNNVMNGKIKVLTSNISTYLFSIGKYIIFDKLKQNKKTYHPDFDITLLKKEEVSSFTLEENTMSKEQQLLAQHFKNLGKKCQELLTLFYYRGLTIQEILKATNYESENVVKSSKSRCLKRLKELIISQK